MHTSFACTLQMLAFIYLGFAMHNKCKHKKHTNTCTKMYVSLKFHATEHLENSLQGRNKSRATEHPNIHFASFS